MSADRLRRADRLVELRKRAVDLAQAADAEATRAVSEAEELARMAEARWSNAAAEPPHARLSSAEFAAESAWIHGLRERADRAEVRATEARKEAAQKRAELVEAKGELRKIELWREGLAAKARAVTERKERLAADEVAARAARRTET